MSFSTQPNVLHGAQPGKTQLWFCSGLRPPPLLLPPPRPLLPPPLPPAPLPLRHHLRSPDHLLAAGFSNECATLWSCGQSGIWAWHFARYWGETKKHHVQVQTFGDPCHWEPQTNAAFGPGVIWSCWVNTLLMNWQRFGKHTIYRF